VAVLSIRATFPLGTYLGHRDVGHRSAFPDTARLHAALLHAAGTGSTATLTANGLEPSAEAVRALEWLDQHPPCGVHLPGTRPCAITGAEAWRPEGVWGKSAQKRRRKPQSDAMAVDGPFGWIWEQDVPDAVVATIDQLCADVSCLGESDSPVVLDLVALDATHELDQSGSAFPRPGGESVRSPLPGRVRELREAHGAARPRRGPTPAQDRVRTDESPAPSTVPSQRVRGLTYRPVGPPPSVAPWSQVALLHVTGAATGGQVRVAVATHRALISRLGEAPSLLTGRYRPGAIRPANRVAIHFLEAPLVRHLGVEGDVIALLMPEGADPAEAAAVERALLGLRRIYGPDGLELDVRDRTDHDAARFWAAVPDGQVRLWRPLPSLVPETRRQRPARGTRPWTLVDAARLSVAYVLRDQIPQGGQESRLALVQAVTDRGVDVHEVHALPDSHPGRHAHRVPDGQVVFPYTALLGLADVVGCRTLMAVGQSRHLGGGLLIPEDVLLPVARARGLI
jgi:CRISPR-associated protein Csb2